MQALRRGVYGIWEGPKVFISLSSPELGPEYLQPQKSLIHIALGCNWKGSLQETFLDSPLAVSSCLSLDL